MKRGFFAVVLFFAVLSVYGQSGGVVPLDEAIQNAALQIQNDLGKGSTIYCVPVPIA